MYKRQAHILFKELLPNCLSPVLTKMALDVGWVILLGASLSFIGLGEQPPTPSFGTMISEGSTYMPDYWWMTAFPALAIVFVILGFNFLGDGIRDMLDKMCIRDSNISMGGVAGLQRSFSGGTYPCGPLSGTAVLETCSEPLRWLCDHVPVHSL